MNPITRLPQVSHYWYEGLMRKCNHNVITKGYAPRELGYRTCSTCHQLVWIPVKDDQYMTDGKYDEEKIKYYAKRDVVPYYPAMPPTKFQDGNQK